MPFSVAGTGSYCSGAFQARCSGSSDGYDDSPLESGKIDRGANPFGAALPVEARFVHAFVKRQYIAVEKLGGHDGRAQRVV